MSTEPVGSAKGRCADVLDWIVVGLQHAPDEVMITSTDVPPRQTSASAVDTKVPTDVVISAVSKDILSAHSLWGVVKVDAMALQVMAVASS